MNKADGRDLLLGSQSAIKANRSNQGAGYPMTAPTPWAPRIERHQCTGFQHKEQADVSN